MLRRVPPVIAMLLAAPLGAQEQYQFEEYRLDNGLRVILSENHSAAVVAINLWYNVGSRNERPGRSGFAHLFEHMMFQGSAHVAKGEHLQLIERAGGSMNGTTNEDRTAYFETLPANRLNLGLWLEADRMRSLAITDENFENQRETVKEERRLRVDNQPYGKAFTEGLTMPYDSATCFPYAHTVIGSMDDLNAAGTQDVQEFFDLYYAPNNATLVVVGDFVPSEAKQLIQDYFGDIPRGADPPPVECTVEYGGLGTSKVFEDEHANLPAAGIAYLIPAHREEDARALQMLGSILGDGESSRLHRALVRESKAALQAFAGAGGRRGPSLFTALAIANQGVDVDTLVAQLREQVAKIAEEGITEEEMEKVKNSFRAGQIFGRQRSIGLSNSLQHYAHYHDSVDEINTDLAKYMAVTADDIARVAKKYLVPENSFTLIVVPKKPGASDEDVEGGAR
ncbi:MAG: M16 family metallopeptidase [Gemmatimonadales bacterium]